MKNIYKFENISVERSGKLNEKLRDKTLMEENIVFVAKALAKFEMDREIMKNAFDVTSLQQSFQEVQRCGVFAEELLGVKYQNAINESVGISTSFLNNMRLTLNERTITGRMRNGHGHLDSYHLYLNDNLIISGLDEDKTRQTDVICEIAHLGGDLDYYNLTEEDEIFFKIFCKEFGEDVNEITRSLYVYYKLFHVNSNIIKLIDETTIYNYPEKKEERLEKLFRLFFRYLEIIE